jgi:hypothetical protein
MQGLFAAFALLLLYLTNIAFIYASPIDPSQEDLNRWHVSSPREKLPELNISESYDLNTAADKRADVDYAINKNVMVVVYNPIVETRNNQRLSQVLGWNNYQDLLTRYIDDVKRLSDDHINYSVVETIIVDDFPTKLSGYKIYR